jgi:hypothetical protein
MEMAESVTLGNRRMTHCCPVLAADAGHEPTTRRGFPMAITRYARRSAGMVRRAVGALIVLSAVFGLMSVSTGAALAAPINPDSRCGFDAQGFRDFQPQYTAPAFLARGNYVDTWPARYGIVNEDAFRVLASGTTRIDHWGANKDVRGDQALAPLSWPLPNERQYVLMAKVTTGRVWLDSRWRWYGANQWFPVGADSGCFAYDSLGQGAPQLQFGINDPGIGDNGGGPWVTVKQWWGWA